MARVSNYGGTLDNLRNVTASLLPRCHSNGQTVDHGDWAPFSLMSSGNRKVLTAKSLGELYLTLYRSPEESVCLYSPSQESWAQRFSVTNNSSRASSCSGFTDTVIHLVCRGKSWVAFRPDPSSPWGPSRLEHCGLLLHW